MINCVMLVKDRERLTRQSLESFVWNSKLDWRLTVVDDCSQGPITLYLDYLRQAYQDRIMVCRCREPVQIVGKLRNIGIAESEKRWGRGTALYVSDNDVFFTEGWELKLHGCLKLRAEGNKPLFKIVGGYRNPYHIPNAIFTLESKAATVRVANVQAVQGMSQMMEWDTWDKYGPYDADTKGLNQGEDAYICDRIRADGFNVGVVQPDIIYHCGRTRTDGLNTGGFELMEPIPNIYME